MAKITIDGRQFDVPDGRRINAIEAAGQAGVEIPHYCYHPGLSVVGSCRMCLVEVGTPDPKTGQVRVQPKLTPGCNLTVSDGMVVLTRSPKVQEARAMVEEDLLLRHPIDCPICDKAGECRLQDYFFRYGRAGRRTDLMPFSSRRRDLGDVTLFVDRCILCTRCVRFCAEVSGTSELMVTRRGAREEIDVVPGFPLRNNLSGNVVDLCPVGALGDKDFLYQQRVWFLRPHAAVCTGCATGCSIWVEENQDRIYRLRPRVNPHVNRWWMCNQGRYGYHHVHDPGRAAAPRRREGAAVSQPDWTVLVGELGERLRRAGRLGGVFSPYLSVEEAYLLATLLRSIDPGAVLAMGPVPAIAEDERYPDGFVVSAEKAPNRRGVEEVLAHFTGPVPGFEHFLDLVRRGEVQGAWVSGGYRDAWIGESAARRFEGLAVLIVQDLFPSPLWERADYALPAAAFAERDGSYVNRGDRLQTAAMAVRPPWGVRPEGGLYWELLGRRGLYDQRAVLDELSREILYFAVAAGPIPEVGVDLKLNRLAGSLEEKTA
ncbi:MAG: 2Fe-2S iron-sulfur cluster-binding protein [Thermoguttaceae bacterium]|jgi:NADH-quinone oxidoreductase subunit G